MSDEVREVIFPGSTFRESSLTSFAGGSTTLSRQYHEHWPRWALAQAVAYLTKGGIVQIDGDKVTYPPSKK